MYRCIDCKWLHKQRTLWFNCKRHDEEWEITVNGLDQVQVQVDRTVDRTVLSAFIRELKHSACLRDGNRK